MGAEMVKLFNSFVARATVVVLASVTVCMTALLIERSLATRHQMYTDFAEAVSDKTALFSSRLAIGIRLKSAGMITPHLEEYLAIPGTSVIALRATHLDGRDVAYRQKDRAGPNGSQALPPPDFDLETATTMLDDRLIVSVPVMVGTGAERAHVGTLTTVWDLASVDARATNAILRAILVIFGCLVVIALIIVFTLWRMVGRPLADIIEAMKDLSEDRVDIVLPKASSREIREARTCLETFRENVAVRSDLARKNAQEEAQRIALVAEREARVAQDKADAEQKAEWDKTEARRIRVEKEVLQTGLRETVAAVTEGDLAHRMSLTGVPDDQVELRKMVNSMIAQMSSAIDDAVTVLVRVEAGDLTARMQGARAGQFGRLQASTNASVDRLESALSDLNRNAAEMLGDCSDLSASAEDLSKRTERTSASLAETTTALDQIGDLIAKAAGSTRAAKESAASARDEAAESDRIVRDAVDSMEKIRAVSSEISKSLGVINDIAFQTNLLALNAGVEAARAGEAGRGFAVVASEVRALAQRASNAAEAISALMSTSAEQVENGVACVDWTGKSLEKLGASVGRIGTQMEEIAASAGEQSDAVQEINRAMSQIDQSTQQNTAMFEEMTTANLSLKNSASHMLGLIETFRIGNAYGDIDRSEATESPPALAS